MVPHAGQSSLHLGLAAARCGTASGEAGAFARRRHRRGRRFELVSGSIATTRTERREKHLEGQNACHRSRRSGGPSAICSRTGPPARRNIRAVRRSLRELRPRCRSRAGTSPVQHPAVNRRACDWPPATPSPLARREQWLDPRCPHRRAARPGHLRSRSNRSRRGSSSARILVYSGWFAVRHHLRRAASVHTARRAWTMLRLPVASGLIASVASSRARCTSP